MHRLNIVTWNINGIRACKVPLKQQLDSFDADIICLQETKVTRDQLDEATAIVDGYSSYFSFSKVRSGYSGVATFVRELATPCRAEDSLSGACSSQSTQPIGSFGHGEEFTTEELIKLDSEGRCIITEHTIVNNAGAEKSLVVINVYCPRAAPDNAERMSFKLQFYRLLQLRAQAILNCGSHVVILGDINTSHKKIDHCNPDEDAEFYANPGRQWMDSFVASSESDLLEHGDRHRFFDTYRWLHPTELNAFTNWCSSTGARQTNYGKRLDYIIADVSLQHDLTACCIMADVEGSDHCPVKAEFSCAAIAAKSCPAICTKHFPQFAGRQQKLLQFFVQKSLSLPRQEPQDNSTNAQLPALPVLEPSLNSCSQESDERIFDCSYSRRTFLDNGDQSRDEERAVSMDKSLFVSTSSSVAETKRRAADPSAQKFKKSKNCDGRSSSGKQSNLLNFFGQGKVQKEPDQLVESHSGVIDVAKSSTRESVEGSSITNQMHTDSQTPVHEIPREADAKDGNTSVMAWKSLLKGPPQSPQCTGHREPCVLRTVKKDGPNKGKQFWTCNRPEGHKNNPDARCEYFVWVTRK